MANLEDFDSVFAFDPKYHFPRDKLTEISHSQNILHGKTFFERLLEDAGISTKPRVFPPQNNRELRRLHEVIIASTCTEDQKQSLLYYILKCVSPPSRGNELADDFASECFLSRRSSTLIEGIWQLDHLHYREAVEILSTPFIPRKHSEDILDVLLDVQEGELAIAYYQTVMPALSHSKVLHKYFQLICQCSITDAYTFMHSQTDPDALFEILLEQALTLHGPARVRSGVELVDLPLTSAEELKMYDYLLHGQGRNLSHAADVVVMRKIATGKLDEVASDINKFSVTTRPYHGMTWQNVVDSINRGTGARSALGSDVD